MRKLLVVVLVAAALWSGYWFVGARAVETAVSGWFSERAEEGWIARYDDLAVRGFPNRFDTTLTGIEIADPRSGLAWSAPFFQVLALSYRPNHVIAVWPERQTIATPIETLDLATGAMRASVVFEAGTRLPLDRTTLIVETGRLTSDAGWTAEVAELRVATRQAAALENAHDLGVEATGLVPGARMRALIDPAGRLPAEIESLRLDATLGFDAPLDLRAVEGRRPALTAVEVNAARGAWGALDLSAAGRVEIDRAGVPEGRIMVTVENWREMLAAAVAAGLVPARLETTAETVLAALAGAEAPADRLEAPLGFQNGFMSFGPLPLGRAPQLVAR